MICMFRCADTIFCESDKNGRREVKTILVQVLRMLHVPGKRNQIMGCITPMISRIIQRFKVF